jgi:hypothetical protein
VGTIATNALLVRIKRYEHNTVGRNYRSGDMRS